MDIKRIISASVCMLFIGVSAALAQDNSIFYKISGKGMDKPSYLLGSFHVVDGRNVHKIPEFDDVFKQVAQCCFETDMEYVPKSSDQQVAQQKQLTLIDILLPPDSTYAKIIGKEKTAVIDSVLSVCMPNFIDNIRPEYAKQIISSVVSVRMLGLTAETAQQGFQPMDYYVFSEAKTGGKKIARLEEPELQQEILDKMAALKAEQAQTETLESQMNGLYDYIANLESTLNSYDEIHNCFAEGRGADLLALVAKVSDGKSQTGLMDVDKRNEAWLKKMPEVLAGGPTLFVVGLAHLLPYHGAEGIVEGLRKMGYSVEEMKR